VREAHWDAPEASSAVDRVRALAVRADLGLAPAGSEQTARELAVLLRCGPLPVDLVRVEP